MMALALTLIAPRAGLPRAAMSHTLLLAAAFACLAVAAGKSEALKVLMLGTHQRLYQPGRAI